MPTIQTNNLSPHGQAAQTAAVTAIEEMFGFAEIALADLTADEIPLDEQLAALSAVKQLALTLRKGMRDKTVDESVAAMFTINASGETAAALGAPNRDVADKAIEQLRAGFGSVSAPEAERRRIVIEQVANGTLKVHPSGELEVVVKANADVADANQAKQDAETARDTAITEKDQALQAKTNAEQAKTKAENVVADIKSHLKRGMGKTHSFKDDELSSDAKAALGL